MVFSRIFLIFCIGLVTCHAKLIAVKNYHSIALNLKVNDEEHTITAQSWLFLNKPDGWFGSISAALANTVNTNGDTRTTINISLNNATGDIYGIALEGFNLPVKVIPNGLTDCPPLICAGDILSQCPVADQENDDNTGAVVACHDNTLVFTQCQLAIGELCLTAASYMIFFM